MSSLEDSLEYDSDDEIYSGPITKREVFARLKQNNFLTDDLLEPLSTFKDTDPLDAKLIAFYDGIFIGDRDYCNEDESQFNLTDILGSVDRSSMEEQLKNQPPITLEDLMKEIQTPSQCTDELIKVKTTESVSENYIKSETTEDSWRSPIKQFESKEMTEASWISPQKQQLESLCLKKEVTQEDIVKTIHSKLESEMSDSIIIINDEIDHISLCSDSMQYSDISNDLVTSLEDTSQHEDTAQVEDIFQDESQQVLQDTASNPLESSNISSSSLEDKSILNDTLEEMKMFMKYGINYMNQKDSESFSSANNSVVNNTPNKVVACSKPILLPKSLNEITPIRVKTNTIQSTPNTPLFVTNTPFSDGITSTPISNIQVIEKDTSEATPFSYKGTPFPNRATPFSNRSTPFSDKGAPSAERSTSVLKPYNRIDSHFKVPTKAPLSTKKSPKFNNIVSPIAMYIKNSPKVPLIKNIVRTHTGFTPNVHSNKKVLVTPQSNSQSEMKQVLPVRSYKPASRNIFMSKETEVVLPGSIRKLIKGPLNPEIVKHMGRMKATPDQYRIASPNPIAASEMTFLSSSTASEGIFNVSTGPPGDISVLVSKSAARTNCLQGSQL